MRKKLARMRKVALETDPQTEQLLASSSEDEVDEDPRPLDFRSSSIQTRVLSPFHDRDHRLVELTPLDSFSYFEGDSARPPCSPSPRTPVHAKNFFRVF